MGGDSLPGKEALFMSVDLRNGEGYADHTAFEALSAIERGERQALRAFRPIIYVTSASSCDLLLSGAAPNLHMGCGVRGVLALL